MSENGIDSEPETHESYGLLGLSRVSCNPAMSLFGSSIKHGNLIELRIKTGRKYRGYQSDRYSGHKTLCRVLLSPTQFAEAITSFNVGDGVPCTVEQVKGDEWDETNRRFRERCPEVNMRQRANSELKEEMAELGTRVDRLSRDAKEILNGKGTLKKADRARLLNDLASITQEIKSNIPFVHECFNESVDKTVTEAKGEIDATYQTLRERLGDKMISAGLIEVPMLESETKGV